MVASVRALLGPLPRHPSHQPERGPHRPGPERDPGDAEPLELADPRRFGARDQVERNARLSDEHGYRLAVDTTRDEDAIGARLTIGASTADTDGESGRPEFSRLRVSDNQRHLVRADGTPFLWLADTAWELFHRLDREEATRYLENRASKGFTVIQAVALAELDGLNTPNAYGHRPLLDNDPTGPDIKDGPDNDCWDHVDFVINKAASLGLHVGLLPTWGDKWHKNGGTGPLVFTEENAAVYGRFIGERYRDHPIVWILGGDKFVGDDTERLVSYPRTRGGERGSGVSASRLGALVAILSAGLVDVEDGEAHELNLWALQHRPDGCCHLHDSKSRTAVFPRFRSSRLNAPLQIDQSHITAYFGVYPESFLRISTAGGWTATLPSSFMPIFFM